jgi:hypothetical protein
MRGQKNNDLPVLQSQKKDAADKAVFRGRRALIKGAAATLPMILTLQSGAALARSSNLIGGTSEASAKDANGNTLCMDMSYATPIGDKYDLGPTPGDVVVNMYPDYEYTKRELPSLLRLRGPAGNEGQRVTVGIREVCESSIDKTFYFKDGPGGWQALPGGNGCLVSLTAISSFADGTFQFQDPTRM